MNEHKDLSGIEKRLSEKLRKAAGRIDEIQSQSETRLKQAMEKAGLDTHGGAGSGSTGLVRAPITPWLKSILARMDLSSALGLRVVDEAMESLFSVQRYLRGTMAAYPTTYCETAREYIEPIIAGMPMPDSKRREILAGIDAITGGGQVPPILQSLGVHIPGAGCFLNGWLMGRTFNLPPLELFNLPQGAAQIVTTASHEKWGHGFITELTRLGKEKASVQLGMNHLAGQFEIRVVDTPDHARLSEQWAILFHTSQYVEEGYATWIERFLAEQLAPSHPHGEALLNCAPSFTVDGILASLPPDDDARACAAALECLFTLSEPDFETVHDALYTVIDRAQALGPQFSKAVGMSAPYAIGYCLMDAIAQAQGPLCVPYAVATACNLAYGLETVSNQDLRNFVTNHPNLNVNTRLAMQLFVSPGDENDVDAYLQRVREEVHLAAP